MPEWLVLPLASVICTPRGLKKYWKASYEKQKTLSESTDTHVVPLIHEFTRWTPLLMFHPLLNTHRQESPSCERQRYISD